MTYATQQDMIDRFGEAELIQLTDRADPPADTVDATVLGAALADADQVVDGYVGARHSLPLASPPALLTTLAAAIARYVLYKDSPTDTVRKNYDDALRQLRDIADGRLALNIADDTPTSDDTIKTKGDGRVFSSQSMKGY